MTTDSHLEGSPRNSPLSQPPDQVRASARTKRTNQLQPAPALKASRSREGALTVGALAKCMETSAATEYSHAPCLQSPREDEMGDCGAVSARACSPANSRPKLVSWYANPTAEQLRAPRSKAAASEESRVWILEVCEDWRTCHVCGAPDVHSSTCILFAGKKFERGFKLWELKSLDDPVDGPTWGRYWYSNLDARPDDVEESEGMPVGKQRFTAWHRSFVKLNLLPGHWVRVSVAAASKIFKKRPLRYVTIINELAERDRAYEKLARSPPLLQPVPQKSKRGRKPKLSAANLDAVPKADGAVVATSSDGHATTEGLTVPVVGPLGGASGEAVQPEKVVVVGASARGRVLKRREVVNIADSDEDFETPPTCKARKAEARLHQVGKKHAQKTPSGRKAANVEIVSMTTP